MLRKLQRTHKIWADKNFADRTPKLPEPIKWRALEMAIHTGKLAHAILKTDQGIRGPAEKHQQKLGSALHSIRNLLTRDDWDVTEPMIQNYPEPPREESMAIQCCLGVVEEAGELAWAVLQDDEDEAKDAVGDVFLYLLDLCNRLGFDMEEIVTDVAEKVHGRDWNKNPRHDDTADAMVYAMRKGVEDVHRHEVSVMSMSKTMSNPVECPKCDGKGWYAYTDDRRPRREYEEKEHIQAPCPVCGGTGDLGLPEDIVYFVVKQADPIAVAEELHHREPGIAGFDRLCNALSEGFGPELLKVRHLKR